MDQVSSHHSEWPGDSSEAGQSQGQEWHQYRLERPHEEKVEKSSKLLVLMHKRSVAYSLQFKSRHSQGRVVGRS